MALGYTVSVCLLNTCIQANLLQSVGCEMAGMMYVDGKIVTVGTELGKQFLQKHPAVLTSFNSFFVYGMP